MSMDGQYEGNAGAVKYLKIQQLIFPGIKSLFER